METASMKVQTSAAGDWSGESAGAGWLSGLRQEWRPMLSLAIPVVMAEFAWMAMNIVDLLMVGKLSVEAIGAVSLGSTLHWGVLIFGFGALLGLDALISQAFGAGDLRECRSWLVHAIYLGLFLAPLLMAVVWIVWPILRWLDIDPNIVSQTRGYLNALNWSTPALLLYTIFRRYLQAQGMVRIVTATVILANVVNAVMNFWLIHGGLGVPALGVAGSGWATFSARVFLALGLGAAIVQAQRRQGSEENAFAWRPQWRRIRELLRIGLPAACHLSLEVLVFAIAGLMAGKLGPAPLAAHQIVLNIASVSFMAPLGIASAGAVRVGQALGAGEPRRARRSGWTAWALGVGFMGIAGLTFWIVPQGLIRLYTDREPIIAAAVPLLLLAALFQLFDGMQVVASGVMRGASETRIPLICNFVAHWIIGLPSAWALCFVAGWGVQGLWVGLTLGLMTSGVALTIAWVYLSRRMERIAERMRIKGDAAPRS